MTGMIIFVINNSSEKSKIAEALAFKKKGNTVI